MARRRRVGTGMALLFDVQAFDRPAPPDPPAPRARSTTARAPAPSAPPTAVSYRLRGVFRWGGGTERTRTAEGHSLRHRLDADIHHFVEYLMRDGWLFAEGRATMVAFLGVWAGDSAQILVSGGAHGPVE